MPRGLNTEFAIGKVDHQLSSANRLSVRYMFFDNFITANVGGGIVSVQRANDFADRQHSTGAQLISTIGVDDAERAARAVRDARAEPRAERAVRHRPGDQHRPASPTSAARSRAIADVGLRLHAERVAGQQQHDVAARQPRASRPASTCSAWPTRAPRRQAQLYTFPNAAAYLAARDGTNRLGYTSFTQYFGLPDLEYNTAQYGFFVQDDWRVASDLKILYGVRYDLYGVPDGDRRRPDRDVARVPDRRATTWRRALARCGRSARSRRSVVRVNTGLMYDQTLNAIYEQALQNDGTNARASATFTPTQAGAPAFPAVLSTGAGAQPNTARRRSTPTSRSRGRGRTTCSSSTPLSDRYSVSDRRART